MEDIKPNLNYAHVRLHALARYNDTGGGEEKGRQVKQLSRHKTQQAAKYNSSVWLKDLERKCCQRVLGKVEERQRQDRKLEKTGKQGIVVVR